MAIGEHNKYLIMLGENQRQFIVTALEQCKLQGYYGADQEDREEIDLLLDMLTDESGLDEDRADREDVVNDFTA